MMKFWVAYVHLPGIPGIVICESGECGIMIENTLSEEEKKYVLKHELAHIHLNHIKSYRGYDPINLNKSYHAMEKEADTFADNMTEQEYNFLMGFCKGVATL